MSEFMRKAKKAGYMLIFLTMFSLLGNGAAVRAENIEYPLKLVSELNKAWHISFTNDLDFSTLNDKTVKLMDQGNNQVPVSISKGTTDRECVIAPKKAYENKKSYTLLLSEGIKSSDGKPLKNGIYMNFKVDTAYGEIYKGSADVQLGMLSSFKTVTVNSCGMPEVKKYKIGESTKTVNLGEALRLVTDSDAVTVYFYTQDEELVGAGTIPVKESRLNLSFDSKLQNIE